MADLPARAKDAWYERPLAPALAIVLICGIAVLLRPEAPFRGMDFVEESRWESAQIAYSLYSGHSFASPFHGAQTGLTAWFPPVYVWITAALYRVFGVYTVGFLLAMRTLNIAFIALNAVLIFHIADRCFGRRVAIFAAWVWALLPYALLFAPGALTIPFDPSYLLLGWYFAFSSFLLSLLFWMTLRIQDSASPRDWLIYGVVWGIAALSNPALLAFSPAAAWFLLSRRAKLSRILVATLMFALVVTPWLIRNSLALNRPTFIRDNFGAELRAGNCEWCEGQWFPAAYPALGARELDRFVNLGERTFIDIETRKATNFIRENPARFVTLCFRRAIYFWSGPPLASSHHPALSGFRNSLFLLSSLLAFAGLWRAFRNHNRYGGLFGGLLLLFPLVYYVTFTTEEYRIPIEPLLLILGTYVVIEASADSRKPKTRDS